MLDTMLDIDIDALDAHIEEMKAIRKEGLLGLSLWSTETGLSMAGYNTPDEATALFNQLSGEIHGTLSGAGFPGLRRYYMLALEDNRSVVVLKHGADLLECLVLDSTKTNLGILLSVAVPKALAAVAAARS